MNMYLSSNEDLNSRETKTILPEVTPSHLESRLARLKFPEKAFKIFSEEYCEINQMIIDKSPECRQVLMEVLLQNTDDAFHYGLINCIKHRACGSAIVELPVTNPDTDLLSRVMVGTAGLLGHLMPDIGHTYPQGVLRQIKVREPSPANAREASPYLNPYIPMRLHTDGAHHEPPPDWFALGKMGPEVARGGETMLLNLNDWEELEYFRKIQPEKSLKWTTPGRFPEESLKALKDGGVATEVESQVITSDDVASSGPRIRYVWRPQLPPLGPGFICDEKQYAFMRELDLSLHESKGIRKIRLEPGEILFCNNLFVLHGRDAFSPTKGLRRDILRLRGYFYKEAE